MSKRVLCLCCIAMAMFALTIGVSAQERYAIKGVLIDSLSGESEPYATVRVYGVEDNKSTLAKVDVTDEKGAFDVALKSAGSYKATFAVVGKQPVEKDFVLTEAKRSIDMGKIYTSAASNLLGEVVVEASRPLIKAEVDKITYDLEADPDAKTNTLVEMLRKVPLVTVDGEENIKVKGSSNFKVLVNGKPNTMMSNNPKEVFRAMPANTVKKIVVVTDPGAKYDAEGVGGVLNIITTDAQVRGYNLSLNARVGNRDMGGGAFATAQVGKFTVSSNFHYNKNFSVNSESESFREDYNNDEFRYLRTHGKGRSKGNFMFGSIEASYELDSLNLFTISGNMYGGKSNYDGISNSVMQRLSGDTRYSYNQRSNSTGDYGNINLGFDYQRSFKKTDEFLTFSYRLDYSPNGSKGESYYTDMVDVPYSLVDQRFDNDAHTEEHTLQIDYVNPIAKKHYIDFGGKYIYRKNYSDVAKWIADGSGKMVATDDPMNHYNQLRNIVAAYTDYKFNSGNFGAKAGARYEYTFMDVKYAQSPDRNYSATMSDIVPSALVSYNLGMTKSLKLSYAMRISRPGIEYLNPYVNNSDPTSISYGNPDLDTEKSHSLGLSFSSFVQKFMMDCRLGYEFQNNGIALYQTLKDGVMSATYGNIAKSKDLSMSLWANYTPWAKTRVMINFYGHYSDYKSEELGVHSYGFSAFSYLNMQQTLPKDFSVSVYVGGNTKSKRLQNTYPGSFFHGLVANKSFLKDKRLNVSLMVNNPFKGKHHFRSEVVSQSFFSSSRSVSPIRSFNLSVSWRFGDLKTTVKRTERSISNDDVKSGGSGSSSSGANGGSNTGGM